jgi:hypothetical protein
MGFVPVAEDAGGEDGFVGDFGGNGDVSEFMAGELAVVGRSIDIHDSGVEGESYDERRVRVLHILFRSIHVGSP